MELNSLKDFHAVHNAYKEKKQQDSKFNPKVESLMEGLGTNQGLRNPLNALRDIGVGLGNAGQKIAKTFYSKAPQVNMEETIGPENPTIPDKLLQGAAQYSGFGAVGGPSLLGQIGAGAAYGYTQSDEDEKNALGFLPEGRGGAAFQSALINALTHGAAHGLEKSRPSKMFRGNLSEEDLQKNLHIAKGTETGLGDVIGSPFLKRQLENTLTKLPFSGATESLQKTGKIVSNKGEALLSHLLGENDPHSVPEKIASELNNQFEQHEAKKTAHYNKFNDLADEHKLKLELPEFSEATKKFSEALKSTNLLQSEPDASNLMKKLIGSSDSSAEKIEKLANAKNTHEPYNHGKEKTSSEVYTNAPAINPSIPEEKAGTTLRVNGKIHEPLGENALPVKKSPSAKDALLLKGKLNKLSQQAKASPDPAQRGLSKVFGALAGALRKDIKTSVSGSNNPKLINALNTAEENYEKEFSPFLEKQIYKYIGGNANPETIVKDFIKTSPHADLAEQLGSLAKKIPEESRNLLGYSYLSRSLDNEGNLNPAKLAEAIGKLKHNQFKALFPDARFRKELRDYSKLAHMNKEAQNLMFNPPTGQRNIDTLTTGLLSLLGGLGSGSIAAVGAPAAAIGAGKVATKLLTSEKVRESLIKAMLENKTKFAKPGAIGGAQALGQALKYNVK